MSIMPILPILCVREKTILKLQFVYLGAYNGTYWLDQMNNSTSYYRPPTRLREGNVFSHVCPSVSHSVHGVPLYRDPSSGRGTSLHWDPAFCKWHLVAIMEICSNVFTSDPSTGADIWCLVHTWSAQAGGTYLTGMFSWFKIQSDPKE